MDHKIETPMWKGRAILDESHASDLEQRAALHEFNNKMPREKAEEQAHEDYRKEHHAKAAASHFAGMKAATATGDTEEAKKHHAMYLLHAKQLGYKGSEAVPEEISRHIEMTKRDPYYQFKPHKADAFLFSNKKDK